MGLIYRVQNDLNQGMYRGRGCHGFTANDMFCDSPHLVHPMPHSDSKLMQAVEARGPGYDFITPMDYFGFGSLDQVRRWIYQCDWRIALDRSGFFIQAWEPAMPAFGDTQAVFLMHESEKADSTRLTSL